MWGRPVVPARKEQQVWRFLSKPCFSWVNWSALNSVLYPAHKVWGCGYSEKTIVCVLHGAAGTRLCYLCGVCVCARARTCVHAHGLKEQGKDKGHLLWPCFCFCFFLVISAPFWSPGGSALPLVSSQSMGRPGKVWLLGSSNMRLFPSWLPSLAQLFLGMGLSPRAACFPGLGPPTCTVLVGWGSWDSLLWVGNTKPGKDQIPGISVGRP